MRYLLIILTLLISYGCKKNLGRNCAMPNECQTIGLVRVVDTTNTPIGSIPVRLVNIGTYEVELEEVTNGNGVATFDVEHQRGGTWGVTLGIEVPNRTIVGGRDFITVKEEQTTQTEIIVI